MFSRRSRRFTQNFAAFFQQTCLPRCIGGPPCLDEGGSHDLFSAAEHLRDLRETKIRVKGNPWETCLFGFPDFLV
jgi:hypothetical protein